MRNLLVVFFIFFYLMSAFAQTDIKPPTVDDSTSVEDAPSPVAIKKIETPISAFDEEEGMIVKKLTTPFEYDRQAKRDPFRLPEVSGMEIPLGAYFGPFLELQEVRLEDVKIKALLLDPLRPKAVIAFSPENNAKPITRKIFVGDYLGENFGIVQAIREGQIVVVQTFVEGEKKFTTTKTLSIRK
ncbi:pilus assembly protein PilP [bacterium]|nr:pilus assembly protein PilP [bacterium]